MKFKEQGFATTKVLLQVHVEPLGTPETCIFTEDIF